MAPVTSYKRRELWMTAVLVAVVTALCYLPALRGEFVIWDDPVYVVNNAHIRVFDRNLLVWAFTDTSTGFWLPVTWLSYAVDYRVWGMDPFGFHLTAILLHSLNSLLVVLLVARLIECAHAASPGGAPPFLRGKSVLVAGGVAGALFGLHPVHVESVAWISERKDVLNAFFFFLAVLCYCSYASREAATPRPLTSRIRDVRYAGTLIFFVLSLLSKPMTVTFPIVLLLIDWYPFGRFDRRRLATLVGEKIPFFLVSICAGTITLLTATPFALVSIDTVSLWSRILVAGKAIVSYLGMMIVPLGLSPLYDHPGNNVSLLMPEYGGSLLLVMLITAGLFFIAGRTRILPVVWLYYLVTLLPVLGLAQNGPQEMADRFTYLPSLGPFLLAGVAAAWLWSRPARERIGVRCAIVLLGVFYFGLLSVLLIRQISVWKDSVVLWDYVIGNGYSRSPRSYNNRGMAYLERGVYDRAIADCTTALSIQPGYYRALYNRGKAYLAIGRPDLALEDLNGSIASSPEYADAYALRGEIRKARGDLGGAIADYTTALSLDPQLYEVYLYRGIALKDSGAFERAIDDYNRTIALVPDSPEAYNSRGAAYRHLGRMEQALADYNRSIALNPEFSLAYCNRGILHKQMKNYESAIADFRKAKALDPDLIKAYLELAECFQATGRIDLAREEYRAACSRKSAEACRALGEFR